jgi:hypothetical protein
MIERKSHFGVQVHFTQGLRTKGPRDQGNVINEKSTLNALWIMFHGWVDFDGSNLNFS